MLSVHARTSPALASHTLGHLNLTHLDIPSHARASSSSALAFEDLSSFEKADDDAALDDGNDGIALA